MRLRGFWRSAALATLILAAAPPAHAWDCSLPSLNLYYYPRAGDSDLPTNMLVWLQGGSALVPEESTLYDPDGDAVQGEWERVLGLGAPTLWLQNEAQWPLFAFRPAAPLLPLATYTLHIRSDVNRYGDPQDLEEVITFTTGAGPSLAMPEPPLVSCIFEESTSPEPGNCATGTYGWVLKFHFPATPNVLVFADRGLDDDRLPSGWFAHMDAFNRWRGRILTFAIYYMCPDGVFCTVLGATEQFRFGLFDVTGAFSGWSDTVTVTFPHSLTGQVEGCVALAAEPDGGAPAETDAGPDGGDPPSGDAGSPGADAGPDGGALVEADAGALAADPACSCGASGNKGAPWLLELSLFFLLAALSGAPRRRRSSTPAAAAPGRPCGAARSIESERPSR